VSKAPWFNSFPESSDAGPWCYKLLLP
jgi:hypothetical protein